MRARTSGSTIAAIVLLTVLAGVGAAVPVQAAPAANPFAGYYSLPSSGPLATISDRGKISGGYERWFYSDFYWTPPYYVQVTIDGAISDLGEMRFRVTTKSGYQGSKLDSSRYDYDATGSLDENGNLVVTYSSGGSEVWTRR